VTPPPAPQTVVGLLLAAGRGTRFSHDGQHDKLLSSLPDGVPVAVAAARPLVNALARVVAIVKPGDTARSALLQNAGCEVVFCDDADANAGMGRVLARGVRHTAQADGWIVALADMPMVRTETISRLAAALAHHHCVAPVVRGQRGNPIAFGRQHGETLMHWQGEHGARTLLDTIDVHRIDTDDEGVLIDIDTPADLERLRAHALR